MIITNIPHTCSSRMLAGFDRWNGTQAGKINNLNKREPYNNYQSPGGQIRELDFICHIFKQVFSTTYRYDDNLTAIRSYRGKRMLLAMTNSEQKNGESFLKIMGFSAVYQEAPMTLWAIAGPSFSKKLEELFKKYCRISCNKERYLQESRDGVLLDSYFKLHFDYDGINKYIIENSDHETSTEKQAFLDTMSNRNKINWHPKIAKGCLVNTSFYALSEITLEWEHVNRQKKETR